MAEVITWQKVILDPEFRSEGVTVADVNRDGRLDVLAGSVWYEAPNWTPHELAPVKTYDAAKGYSDSFLNFAHDVDGDGWPDQIVIGFPGERAFWRENTRGAAGHWREHTIWRTACNESPAFGPVEPGGLPTLVMAYDEQYMAWLEPGPDPRAEWVCHTIGEAGQPGTKRYSHGLGLGDVNGDGRPDVITTEGWYQAPQDPRTGPWTFVPADLGPACAQMLAYDVNGDGLPDVITSSVHDYGIWWHERCADSDEPRWISHLIDDSFSQSHALVLADIDGDGVQDIVTGKRFWAHGPTGDVGADEPCVLCWYQLHRGGGEVRRTRHLIDDDSGVGTQFVVADVNGDGLLDVVTSNKKGVFLFLQRRG